MSPGDVVTAYLGGADVSKFRPAVVVSNSSYHAACSDVIVAFISSRIPVAPRPIDYVLKDWRAANLNKPSFVEIYLVTVKESHAARIGVLSQRDWAEVQKRLRFGLAI